METVFAVYVCRNPRRGWWLKLVTSDELEARQRADTWGRTVGCRALVRLFDAHEQPPKHLSGEPLSVF